MIRCTICNHEPLQEEKFIPILKRHADLMDCIVNLKRRIETLEERILSAESELYSPERYLL
jgi:hypothetical protein